ncbi:MAG: ester cyclase [Leptospiraceae bacterium]|nr:ester cyclase [Leptospiraceae bacterium]
MTEINKDSTQIFHNSIDIGLKYTEAWNSKDPKQVLDLFSPDAKFYGPNDPEGIGLDAIEKKVLDFTTGFPDFVFTNMSLNNVGNSVSSLQWMFAGTHTGEFSKIPPSGNEVWLPGISVFTLKDGKIINLRDSFNMEVFIEQIEKGTYNLEQFKKMLGLELPLKK